MPKEKIELKDGTEFVLEDERVSVIDPEIREHDLEDGVAPDAAGVVLQYDLTDAATVKDLAIALRLTYRHVERRLDRLTGGVGARR